MKNLVVLYTGGTIGMQQTHEGLAPASGFEACLHERLDGLALKWRFQELPPPLDSANMRQENWLTMRDAIVTAVEHGHDGVLLLHGTDTLAYSAAALSFLLLGLSVPVVLTGSMLPLGSPDSDAWPNLTGAIEALSGDLAPGVHLFFDSSLLHGARASKLRSEGFDAFTVPPRPRTGKRATAIVPQLDYRQPRQPVNLAVLPLFPGIQASHLRALLDSGVRGLILECYGNGTGPANDKALLDCLRDAHQRGVVLVASSQCPAGHVQIGVYAAGNRLLDTGLVPAGGMTREATLGKLFALLGAGLEQAEVEHWLTLDLCGELAD